VSRRVVFLTGATGFLGMEVLVRLLERPDTEVRALVRADDREGAEARLDDVLATLWHDPAPYRERVRAVPGELTSPGLGIEDGERAALAAELHAVLHCAASISFSLPLEDARAINVDGTRRVIDLAREATGLERFLHVSTAYVAGLRGGRFRERQLDTGQRFRNTYEQTKWESEHLVAAAGDLAPCIARPSIVVGESDSGWTPAFNVLYWPLRAFARGLFDQVPARLDAHIDVVPVDYVADGIVHLLDRDDAGVVNLVSGEEALRARELMDLACGRFGREPPPVVEPGSSAGASADEHGAVYLPYFDMDVIFDDARARAVLAPAGIRPPLLGDYFGTLMDYAELARWGKNGITREEAREGLEALAA
jgi:long-chain acyl-CoA synthetase